MRFLKAKRSRVRQQTNKTNTKLCENVTGYKDKYTYLDMMGLRMSCGKDVSENLFY